HWLAPHFDDDLRLEYDLDAIPALSHDRLALWQRIGRADFLTPNEKRAAVGLGAISGGDSLE
ncbi:MAG: portal protein, partial [Alphaproteobacteria bacterium]